MIPMEQQMRDIVRKALEEDMGDGDVTTNPIVPPDRRGYGRFVVKEKGIIAGLQVAETAFQILDDQAQFETMINDGERAKVGSVIAAVEGKGRALLSAERVALNFLQRMSGVASLTRQFVDAVSGTSAVILDTRKTAPGLRAFDKWAVLLGGGQNHRFGLYDMVLVKNNHIHMAGSITEAVSRVRAGEGARFEIEVEVRDMEELREALELRVDRILLDNMNMEELAQAVKIADGRVPLEASGNVDLGNVTAIAATGVDFISIGRLTHSAKALDISFLMEET
ncbi:MAG: carboxylating nicotinate-nucleotide diphosphorylase [Deltaproteobacteria bacterium]|nr:carboxylating nicotinate-nucleotide diphosphorylase [Deltaproteobacteria bacterium]